MFVDTEQMRFTHKWLTVENMSGARRVFLDTMRVLKEIMGGLAKASPAERGDLEWSKVFSYGCHPRNVCGCKGGWGIEPAGYYCHPREQGGANGSAQKAIQELLIKYMEVCSKMQVFYDERAAYRWIKRCRNPCTK